MITLQVQMSRNCVRERKAFISLRGDYITNKKSAQLKVIKCTFVHNPPSISLSLSLSINCLMYTK